MKKIFITGTGTDVGKTYVTGLILKKLHDHGKRAAYFKAAMSGNVRRPDGSLIPGDALAVKAISQIKQPLHEMCPYIYEASVSPHLAARLEGNPVDLSLVLDRLDDLCARYDYVTVEGSGGILCPLRFDGQKIHLEDLIRARNFSCLIVADAGLGTINAVGLTAAYLQARNIPINGIILNRFIPGNPLHEDNLFMCEAITGEKVVACVSEGSRNLELPLESMEALYQKGRRKTP